MQALWRSVSLSIEGTQFHGEDNGVYKTVHKANSDGSIGVTVSGFVQDPNNEGIETGDVVQFEIKKIGKQGDT